MILSYIRTVQKVKSIATPENLTSNLVLVSQWCNDLINLRLQLILYKYINLFYTILTTDNEVMRQLRRISITDKKFTLICSRQFFTVNVQFWRSCKNGGPPWFSVLRWSYGSTDCVVFRFWVTKWNTTVEELSRSSASSIINKEINQSNQHQASQSKENNSQHNSNENQRLKNTSCESKSRNACLQQTIVHVVKHWAAILDIRAVPLSWPWSLVSWRSLSRFSFCRFSCAWVILSLPVCLCPWVVVWNNFTVNDGNHLVLLCSFGIAQDQYVV